MRVLVRCANLHRFNPRKERTLTCADLDLDAIEFNRVLYYDRRLYCSLVQHSELRILG